MIVLDPRIPDPDRQHRRGEMVLNIDVAPTVLALAGEPVPNEMQGQSMIPLLRQGKADWRDAFFCENNFRLHNQYYPMMEGVRTDEWKYVRYPEINPVYEQLFELEKDPHETENLAGDDEYSRSLARMRQLCDRYLLQATPEE